MISDVLRALHHGTFTAASYARKLRTDVIADFRRWHPAIVIVQRCGDPQREPCEFGNGFKVVKWLSRDPSFPPIWSQYRLVRSIDRFDIYVRNRTSSP